MAISSEDLQTQDKQAEKTAVLIVGAGFSGICAAIDQIRLSNNHDFIIVEKSNQVGGTWNDNKYPGARSDVPAHLYSLSFAPNPNWTREYPDAQEIQDYLIDTAQKWGLYRHIRFGTEVEELRWDDKAYEWVAKLKLNGGKPSEFTASYSVKADFVISATGQNNVPRYPNIEGLDTFAGKIVHSSRWNRNISVEGKRVAVIGTGCSGVQIIPEVAKIAQHLTVFQRSAGWAIPKGDQPISEELQKAYREDDNLRLKKRAAIIDRNAGAWPAMSGENPELSAVFTQLCLQNMHQQMPDHPELWEKLTPKFKIGGKRIMFSDDYFQSLTRENVTLETEKIQKITSNGVQVDKKVHQVDILILATGFRADEVVGSFKAFGSGGRSLDDIWKGLMDVKAHLGFLIEDLPNFASLFGPTANTVYTSILQIMECQSRYVAELTKLVQEARKEGRTLSIAPQKQAVDEYWSDIQARVGKMPVGSTSVDNWYKGKNGKVILIWPGEIQAYQDRTSKVNLSDFIFSGSDSDRVRSRDDISLGLIPFEQGTKSLI